MVRFNRLSAIFSLFSLVAFVEAQQHPLGTYLNDDAANNIRFICNFEHNACHFRNQFNLGRFARLKQAAGFLGERAVLILDLSRPEAKKHPGARLITHYFRTDYLNACMYLTYHISGLGPSAFYVIQQDTENRCIYADEYEVKTSTGYGGWKSVQLQLDLKEGSPRFFLQAEYDPSHNGYVAIANITYAYGKCRTNQANYCFSDFNENNYDENSNNNNNNAGDNFRPIPVTPPSNRPIPGAV